MSDRRAPIEARYVGTCAANCSSPIYIGDSILATDDERWAHVECMEDVESVAREEKPTRFQGTSLDEMGF